MSLELHVQSSIIKQKNKTVCVDDAYCRTVKLENYIRMRGRGAHAYNIYIACKNIYSCKFFDPILEFSKSTKIQKVSIW